MASNGEADGSVMKVSEQRGSFIGGMVGLSGNAFDMVGTSNGRGSTVMMCDGSVKTATGASALIGLLFTGGATAPAAGGAPEVVGHWGAGPFAVFLPAVQRTRGGAMSFSYAAPGA